MQHLEFYEFYGVENRLPREFVDSAHAHHAYLNLNLRICGLIAKAGAFVSLEGCKYQSVHLYPKNRPKNSQSSSLKYYHT